MAGRFHNYQARHTLVHMAHVWLRLADNYDDVILPAAATEQARPVVQQQQQIQPKHYEKKN